ncbi:hypothetical protein [Nodosilinea sp. E11]|uniref:hypothetical protein n=1 Tax=Nodosilinea sp. E11 TaxID=3037479 RepID=UPI0029346577|nr:hypothetical protein [Nodosilinea sp. E11]WOD37171.1 hypothetical protein RRF56_01560 [Nodosilinea sp. E11]
MVRQIPALVLLAALGVVSGAGAIPLWGGFANASPLNPVPAQEALAQPEAQREAASEAGLTAADFNLPLGVLRIGDRQAAIPDWRLIAFSDLPVLAESGTWGAVSWQRGDAIADVLTVGDLQGGFDVHLLTVAAIADQLGVYASKGRDGGIRVIPLDKFGLLNYQTLSSLIRAAPALLSLTVSDSRVVKDLIAIVDPTFVATGGTTLGELIKQQPKYGEISLSYLDLANYTIGELPGIEIAPIQNFSQWESAKLTEVPLLEHLSLWTLPGKIGVQGEIAIATVQEADDGAVDVVFSAPESAPGQARSLRWRVGQRQVGGMGTGDLTTVNQGLERLGAAIYNPSFKVVPHRVSRDEIQLVAYFRTCRQSGEGTAADCSPYGIGPIPFMVVKPGDAVFLGQQAFGAIPYSPTPEPLALAPDESSRVSQAIEALADNPGPAWLVAFSSTLALALVWGLWKGNPAQLFTLLAQVTRDLPPVQNQSQKHSSTRSRPNPKSQKKA